jgi:hypothetical protein
MLEEKYNRNTPGLVFYECRKEKDAHSVIKATYCYSEEDKKLLENVVYPEHIKEYLEEHKNQDEIVITAMYGFKRKYIKKELMKLLKQLNKENLYKSKFSLFRYIKQLFLRIIYIKDINTSNKKFKESIRTNKLVSNIEPFYL